MATASCNHDGGEDRGRDARLFELIPHAAARAPLSQDNNIALVSDSVACVIDSYNYRVVCTAMEGSVLSAFGEKGEGPGEFMNPVRVARASRDTLAVHDLKLDRLTYYEPTGQRLFEASLPPLFGVEVVRGMRVFGHLGLGPPVGEAKALPMEHIEMDVAADSVVWSRDDMWIVPTECGDHGAGIPTPSDGYVFRACQSDLVFYHDRDGDPTVVTSPAYVPELPNERDVDDYLSDMARIFGRGSVAKSAYEPYAAGYREDPKPWFLVDGFVFDSLGRLWVATTRDLDTFSYFDIWDGPDYQGTVRIRDRLIGYDILGSALVALVERKPDRYGIAQRAIDWYDIGGVAFDPEGS